MIRDCRIYEDPVPVHGDVVVAAPDPLRWYPVAAVAQDRTSRWAGAARKVAAGQPGASSRGALWSDLTIIQEQPTSPYTRSSASLTYVHISPPRVPLAVMNVGLTTYDEEQDPAVALRTIAWGQDVPLGHKAEIVRYPFRAAHLGQGLKSLTQLRRFTSPFKPMAWGIAQYAFLVPPDQLWALWRDGEERWSLAVVVTLRVNDMKRFDAVLPDAEAFVHGMRLSPTAPAESADAQPWERTWI